MVNKKMKQFDIKDLYEGKNELIGTDVNVCGWIKNHRKQKEFGFIDLFDGTCVGTLQVVYDDKLANFDDITKYRVGSSIMVTGELIKSPKEGQEFEMV